ncbi:MAG: CmcI family methyltransferase [Pirellula sp.]
MLTPFSPNVSMDEARHAVHMNRLYRQLFFRDVVHKTNNFGNLKWMGNPIWQNIFDLWIIQETIAEIKPSLLIECGTNQGGSALFYANLFDLMDHGRIVTIDVQSMHSIKHPRIQFLLGSSTAPEIFEVIQQEVAKTEGPIMVILDSDHSAKHVAQEMKLYSPLVTPGSFMLVQDGVADVLEPLMAPPGPLVAIHEFLPHHPEFEVDHQRCEKFLITHHPLGWLRRKPL